MQVVRIFLALRLFRLPPLMSTAPLKTSHLPFAFAPAVFFAERASKIKRIVLSLTSGYSLEPLPGVGAVKGGPSASLNLQPPLWKHRGGLWGCGTSFLVLQLFLLSRPVKLPWEEGETREGRDENNGLSCNSQTDKVWSRGGGVCVFMLGGGVGRVCVCVCVCVWRLARRWR